MARSMYHPETLAYWNENVFHPAHRLSEKQDTTGKSKANTIDMSGEKIVPSLEGVEMTQEEKVDSSVTDTRVSLSERTRQS